MKLCFATNNQHKLEEVRQAVQNKFEILSLKDIQCFEELPETHDTLEGNSLEKAEYVFKKYKFPCFADDSGLEVFSLNNEPGVDSAHYAGPQRSFDDNIDLLLKNLKSHSDRKGKFRAIITLCGLSKDPVYFEGAISGVILTERRGTSGFGYDPVFQPDGHSRSFAEMTLEEKNQLSHRAIAVQKLIQYLNQNF